MKYLLLIHHDEHVWNALGQAERQEMYGEYRTLIGELHAGGHYVDGSQLQPTAAATTVRVRDGRRLVTDGPFAETREQLGGYFLIDVPDLDQALAIAARIPAARMGTIEVRPLESGAPNPV